MTVILVTSITTVYATAYTAYTALETLSALNYNSFILTLAIIGVGNYSIEALILMLEICIITVIVKGHVYYWKYHPCINYYNIFRLCIHVGMRIYMNLKVYILPPLNLIFSQAMLNVVVYQMSAAPNFNFRKISVRKTI